MRAPPLLLGAALLFWGWQTGFFVAGLVMALVVESSRVTRTRWDLSRADFNRVSDMSAVLLVAVVVWQALANESARAVTGVFQWLPLVLFPLVVCQLYSAAGTVDASIFFWSQRRRANEGQRPPVPVDLTYPYFALGVLAASAANVRSVSFYLGLVVLAAWALWSRRSPRYHPAAWIGAVVVAVALGYGGHVGLAEMQRILESRASAWLLEWIRRRDSSDPFRSATALGQIGEVKLTDRIVLRVSAEPTVRTPLLLREAAYNVYASPTWFAVDGGFTAVQPEADGATWVLGAADGNDRKVTISTYLARGRGVLPLPAGANLLDGLIVVQLGKNALGAVRVDEGLALVTYGASFGAASGVEGAPGPSDLAIPAGEVAAVATVARELNLAGRRPADAALAIHGLFLGRFRYSRFLRERPVAESPLADFLLRTRSGHCEYFATATVLLLRAAGIPARYAVGYAVHERSRLEGRFIARARDAHSWAQAWIDGAWRDIDTTPPAWIDSERQAASFWEPVTDLWSWAGFLFSRWRWSERQDRLTGNLGWLLIPLLALLAWRLYARKRVTRAPPTSPLPAAHPNPCGADSEFYLVEQRLAALAFGRAPAEPMSAWLSRIDEARLPSISTADLAPLLALHYRHRFDPEGLTPAERAQLDAGARAWLALHEG
ncbi:MAG TPA: transglutaminase-like domain-containing protein [Methylomirabilota bacterium]|nr:transglutaminase-like domain-containing protein [Methylomirabilota bacterium]